MRYFEKLYIRAQNSVNFSTETFPLAFATPYEENAAFKKRKETVDNWASRRQIYDHELKKYVNDPTPLEEPSIIDNLPIEGFEFDKDVSRWSTSNKWFRIKDPRGFTLEISSANLTDIVLNGDLSKGKLIGKYVWAREGQNNYLIRDDHPDYLSTLKLEKNTDLSLVPGDIIQLANGEKYIFIGKRYKIVETYTTKYYDSLGKETDRYYSYNGFKTISNTIKIFPDIDRKAEVFLFVTEENKYTKDWKKLPEKFIKVGKTNQKIEFAEEPWKTAHYFEDYQEYLDFKVSPKYMNVRTAYTKYEIVWPVNADEN